MDLADSLAQYWLSVFSNPLTLQRAIFPCSSVSKDSVCNAGNPACNAGDGGLVRGPGRSPGDGNGSLLRYSHLENPIDRGAWWVTVHGLKRARHGLGTKLLQPNPVHLRGAASPLRWRHRGFPLRGPGPDLVWMGWATGRGLGS